MPDTVANEHPKNGRVTVSGSHLFIMEMSTDDTVPVSDCSHTEGNGKFVAGDEGGLEQVTAEWTGIKIGGEGVPVVAGQAYEATAVHTSSKSANTGYSGTFYVENVRRQGQVSQTGPATFTARGTFTGDFTRPTA